MENLVQLCSYHHRLVHEGGFRVECARGSVRFRRPDGTAIAGVGGGKAASGAGLAEQHRACGVAVDRDTCRPRSAGDRLDYDLAVDVLVHRAARLIDNGRAVPGEHPGPLQAPP